MTWHTGPLLAFDTETSGVDVETDRIVSAAAIHLGGGQPTQAATWLSDVDGIEIPEAATAVHGISTEQARTHGRPAKQVTEEVVTALAEATASGTPIVGHNLPYDLTLLDREARRHLGCGLHDAIPEDKLRVIDTRVLDQHVLPRRRRVSPTQGARQLITVAQVYGLPWDEQAAHGSEYDALMSARIAYRIGQIARTAPEDRPTFVLRDRFQRFDDIADLDLEQLHAAQVIWAAEQAASLQEWFRSQPGKEDTVVNGAWPLIPFGGER